MIHTITLFRNNVHHLNPQGDTRILNLDPILMQQIDTAEHWQHTVYFCRLITVCFRYG